MTSADIDLYMTIGRDLVGLIVLPIAYWAYQKRTGVAVTDQERAAISAALDTAKGQIETDIDQGHLTIGEVVADHPAIVQAAQDALARVPAAAAAQNVSLGTAAQIIVGRVDTSSRPRVVAYMPTAPSIPRV